MADELDEAIEQMMNTGLDQHSSDEIVRRLDAELQQQTEASAMVLSGAEPEPWVLGGEQAGGFGSLAQRFLNYYSDALHREICDPQGGGLNQQYQSLLGGADLKSQIKTLAPVVLATLGVSATLVAPATVAAIVALWLLRMGLAQWCAEAPAAPGQGTPPATGGTTTTPAGPGTPATGGTTTTPPAAPGTPAASDTTTTSPTST